MHHNFKKSLLRSSAIVGPLSAGLLATSPAQAANVDSAAITFIGGGPGSCQIQLTSAVTGVISDGAAGSDFYRIAVETSGGVEVSNRVNRVVAVGQTDSFQPLLTIPTSLGPDSYVVVIRDTIAAGAASGTIIGSVPITNAALLTASADCPSLGFANASPTVNAGLDETVAGGATVNLSGSATDPETDPLTYSWTQVSGPAVTLADANTLTPSFTAPAKTNSVQTLEFSLVANDGTSNSAPDNVVISVAANIGPNVSAGAPQTVGSGSQVTLDGSGTVDGDGDTLFYNWIQAGGPPVALTGDTTATPSFTAPVVTGTSQTLTFVLIVADGNTSSTATTTVEVLANSPPTVDAGNDSTWPGGSQVFLEGTATDPESDPLTYQWVQLSGTPVTLLDDTTLNPNFIAPPKSATAQVLTFGLIANDGTSNSAQDTVTVTIPANVGPTANAGADQSVTGNSTVTLDGSASVDGDGDTLTYQWVQTAGPAVTLSSATAASPSFTAPAANGSTQTLSFELVVSDGVTSSVADSVDITILANSPPVANAGADQGPIDSGQTVTLDGTGSSDPDNDTLSYTWTQLSGTPVTLTNATSANPGFTAPLVNGNEDLVFQLVVSDGQADSAPDTVTIGIRAVGSVTIIQRVIGADRSFAFTSDIASLSGSLTTSGGNGQLSATGVSAGNHTISAADYSAAGYAITDISCNDSDSVISLSGRSIALSLSPNENLVCTFTSADSRSAASQAIGNFLTGRNALILSQQPDLQRRLDRLQGAPGSAGSAMAFGLPVPGSGSLPFAMQLGSGSGRISTSLAMAAAAAGDPDRGSQPLDIWAEASYSRARFASQSGNFSIYHIGADYRLSSKLLVGVLGEFDDFNDQGTLDAGEAEGNGWMVGPYVMGRIAPQLYGELRAAWGKSDNRVSPLGTYIDSFKTNRSYYSGSLVGDLNVGKQTVIRPEFTVRYLSEKALAYTDSLGVVIPSQTVDQGDLSFRPRVMHRLDLDGGWSLRPFGEAEGIYTFGTGANSVLDNGLRMRVEGGMDLFSPGTFRASIGAFHDGIRSDNFRNNGITMQISFGF
ncbi:MAG: autotransporter domain-containing protein [Sphingomonadaceae bacterium]|nr:autotransporter domain-containing protein [Sphingomonadaceae bacterium]